MKKKTGRIFVVSAPSGCGKTTICGNVFKRVKNLIPSVSATTRPPRPDEKHKKDYYYMSRETFNKECKSGGFLEWEKNFGHFYGTPKRFALEKIKEGKDLLLSIDVKGAMHVKKKLPESILIFIKPPSFGALSERLNKRKTDGKAEIKKRLKIAKKELAYIPRYDHVVVNKRLKDAVSEVVSIIKQER